MALTVPFMTFPRLFQPSDTTANLGRFVGISRRKERVKAKENQLTWGGGFIVETKGLEGLDTSSSEP